MLTHPTIYKPQAKLNTGTPDVLPLVETSTSPVTWHEQLLSLLVYTGSTLPVVTTERVRRFVPRFELNTTCERRLDTTVDAMEGGTGSHMAAIFAWSTPTVGFHASRSRPHPSYSVYIKGQSLSLT